MMMPREPYQSLNLLTHVLKINASSSEDDRLEEVLQSFWKLETLGIAGSEESILDVFNQTIQFRKGFYEVTLTWKVSHPPLPDNYCLCQKRLKGLLHQLENNPEIMQEYDTIICTQLQQGIVEEVSQPDDAPAS